MRGGVAHHPEGPGDEVKHNGESGFFATQWRAIRYAHRYPTHPEHPSWVAHPNTIQNTSIKYSRFPKPIWLSSNVREKRERERQHSTVQPYIRRVCGTPKVIVPFRSMVFQCLRVCGGSTTNRRSRRNGSAGGGSALLRRRCAMRATQNRPRIGKGTAHHPLHPFRVAHPIASGRITSRTRFLPERNIFFRR